MLREPLQRRAILNVQACKTKLEETSRRAVSCEADIRCAESE